MVHVTTDLPCPRCERRQAVEERYEKQGEVNLTCFNCGYQHARERSWEAYQAPKEAGDPTSGEVYVTSEHLAPGLTMTEYEDGLVEVAPLPWSDPNGDAYRREVRERSPQAGAHGRIVTATIRLRHPNANRWEPHHITTMEEP